MRESFVEFSNEMYKALNIFREETHLNEVYAITFKIEVTNCYWRFKCLIVVFKRFMDLLTMLTKQPLPQIAVS